MRRQEASGKTTMLLLAGFGDNASMFDALPDTELAERFEVMPLDLPGFGRAAAGETSLSSLAGFVAEKAVETGAEIVVAHSVASIVASLAARRPGCPLKTILSLEGNLTADDAYFSGTAADYDSPAAFRAAFLARLDRMAETSPEIARYRREVAQADPRALWELGRDARRFSERYHPGEILRDAAAAVYLYNPDNCPETTLAWLRDHDLPRLLLDNATHWKSVSQPRELARKIGQALESLR